MPSIPNRLQPDTPFADNLALINDAFDAIDNENQTKITRNGNQPTLLYGYQKGGFGALDYGLKASKINPATGSPYDVTTATDDQLAFSTAFATFKIVGQTTLAATRTPGSTTGSADYIYNLSYTPIVIVSPWGGVAFPIISVNNTSGAIDEIAYLTHNAFLKTISLTIMAPTGGANHAFGSNQIAQLYLLRDIGA